MFKRDTIGLIASRIQEERRFIQVMAGPRQVGKSTLAKQLVDELSMPMHLVSADEPVLCDNTWLAQQWEVARQHLRGASGTPAHGLLIVDEIQKVSGWSETVKRLWDEDSRTALPLRVLLLGSAQLLVQKGLGESLAGRFEMIPVTHWTYREMKEAFGFSLEQYLYFGGYPGAAGLIGDEPRWRRYVVESLIEPTVSKDILMMTRVDKPALLKNLFHMACLYSARIISYQKLIGQLHDAGNTTTLSHYLDLLGTAGLAVGLQKFSGSQIRQRASSPKLQVLNNALMSALSGKTFSEAFADPAYKGRLVESAVGAYLVNQSRVSDLDVLYWNESSLEVDFVLRQGSRVTALEVKSGRPRDALGGMARFCAAFPSARPLLIGDGGLPLEEFLSLPAVRLLAP